MKTMLSSKRHHYLAKFSIFLVVVALIAGMVSCGDGGESYTLTIASTAGGSVTIPGEGTFTYSPGTVVALVAEAEVEEGYCFVEWTGDVGTVNVRAATTTVAMGDNYSITANFVGIIEICDWYDLDAIRDNLGCNYLLMNDLDSTTAGYEELASPTANHGKGWEPIITTDGPSTGRTFDGQGYEISDLFINRLGEYGVGLFGVVEPDGVIENIGVVNVTVTGSNCVGGLVGFIDNATVSNCYSIGNITGNENVGGLVGYNQVGTVSNSYSTGSVTGNWSVGGLAGVNWGTVSNSYSTGSVTGNDYVGGLMGMNEGTASDSYSTGSVTGNDYVGGLVGENSDTVSNSYSTGSVTGGNWSVGGLVGESYGTVSNSFWDTETSGQATSAGGTGKTTAEMKSITTFSGAAWSITAVAPGSTNTTYTWNIVNGVTYPFLSWQSVS